MLALAHKIINMGEIDGYTILGGYLYAIEKTEEGIAALEKVVELGNSKAALTLFNLEMSKVDLENEPSEERAKNNK